MRTDCDELEHTRTFENKDVQLKNGNETALSTKTADVLLTEE
jgi:hypothetical protein